MSLSFSSGASAGTLCYRGRDEEGDGDGEPAVRWLLVAALQGGPLLLAHRGDGRQALLEGLVVLAELLALVLDLEDGALLPARGVVEGLFDGALKLVEDGVHARHLLEAAGLERVHEGAAAPRGPVPQEVGEGALDDRPTVG